MTLPEGNTATSLLPSTPSCLCLASASDPGYQGNPRVFAHDHMRDLAGGAADNDNALLGTDATTAGEDVGIAV